MKVSVKSKLVLTLFKRVPTAVLIELNDKEANELRDRIAETSLADRRRIFGEDLMPHDIFERIHDDICERLGDTQ